jgi:DNA replication initiation complex subunit (GINS family)
VYWVANNQTYETLWQAAQKERQTNELQILPKTFYDETSEFLKSLEGREITDEEASTKKNTLKLLDELYERRKQKILIYVAYKRQLPQPAIQREVDFYNSLLEQVERNKISASPPAQGPGHKHMLKSTQSLPEITLPSGKKLGPLEKGQLIEMQGEEDVKFLITSTICQQA